MRGKTLKSLSWVMGTDHAGPTTSLLIIQLASWLDARVLGGILGLRVTPLVTFLSLASSEIGRLPSRCPGRKACYFLLLTFFCHGRSFPFRLKQSSARVSPSNPRMYNCGKFRTAV